MLKPVYEEVELGRAEIRAIFKSSKVGNIAGCMVKSGLIKRNAKARLLVREGFECGLTVTYSDIKVDDVIESYELQEKARD